MLKKSFVIAAVLFFLMGSSLIKSSSEKLSYAQVKSLDSVETAQWYTNDNFLFKIKKIPGWDFKNIKGIEQDVPMLNLAFTKPSVDGDFKNMVIINVAKLEKPKNYAGAQGYSALADQIINSSVQNLSGISFIQQPQTISINNLEARYAIFEWQDERYGNEKFTNTLIIFFPFATDTELLNASVLFKCKSKEYPLLRSEVEEGIKSITIGGASSY